MLFFAPWAVFERWALRDWNMVVVVDVDHGAGESAKGEFQNGQK